jgi:hypothetical protein
MAHLRASSKARLVRARAEKVYSWSVLKPVTQIRLDNQLRGTGRGGQKFDRAQIDRARGQCLAATRAFTWVLKLRS